MQLVLNDDQSLLAETARGLVSEHAPPARLRRLREDPLGFDPTLWARIVELGWVAIPFAEADSGLGLGLAEVACVTEALGRGLAPEPYLSNVLLAGGLVAALGSAAQREAELAPMLAGARHLAFAGAERGTRFDLTRGSATAGRSGGGYRLSGEKPQVLGGSAAETFVVLARTSGSPGEREGLSLFLVPRDAAGVTVERQYRVDAAPTSRLLLADVAVPEAALLGPEGGAMDAVDAAIDRATVALAAEMLGGMSEALDRTLRYLKERVQFDVLIGSFQALRHRAARLFIEVELTRSAVMAAARALDEGAPNARALVSVAKARANDAFLLIANEAIQLHGGIGMTDEHDIGFFLKRARAAEMTFGDAAYHRARFAAVSGF